MRMSWLVILVGLTLTLHSTKVTAQQEAPNSLANNARNDLPEQASDSLTVDQVVRQVVQRNDRIAAARFMREAAEHRANSTGVWDDPMLMLGAQNVPANLDFTMDPMTMKMIGLSQNIPYAGYKGLERKATQAEAAAALQDQRGTEIDMVAAARTAFYDVYYFRQTLKELQLQREVLQQIVSSATSRLRADQAGQDEVLAAQADVWRLENAILSAEQEMTASETRLNSIRGEDPTRPLPPLATPNDFTIPASVDTWLTETARNYPPLARLQKQAESYDFSARANRRMQWPMLNLQASYGIRSGFDMGMDGLEVKRDNMLSLQANISLPVFGRGRQQQMARSMEMMKRGTAAEADQLQRDVQADLTTLYLRAQRLSQSLTNYRNKIIPATEDAFRSALAGYTANRTTFASLSSYSLSLYRDRMTAIQLANDLARTLIEVDRYTKGTAAWENTITSPERSK